MAELDSLGVPDVYDLAGGFDAWAAAGLPIVANSDRGWFSWRVGVSETPFRQKNRQGPIVANS